MGTTFISIKKPKPSLNGIAVATFLLWSCSRTGLDFPSVTTASSSASGGLGGLGGNGAETVANSSGSTSTSTSGTGSTGGGGAGGNSPVCDWGGSTALWNKRFGDDCAQRGTHVAADSTGNVVLFGRHCGDIDLGSGWSGIDIAPDSERAIFLARYTPAGAPIWSRVMTGPTHPMIQPHSLVVSADGSIIIAGTFDQSIDLGTGPMTAGDNHGAFVAVIDTDGKTIWARAWDGIDGGQAYATLRPNGHTLLAISAKSTLDLGGGPLPAAGDYDILLVALDAAGKHIWSRRFGDTALQNIYGIVAVPDGVVITGVFEGKLDFGGTPLTAEGQDSFAAKLDDGGNLIWARHFPANGVGSAYLRLAADPVGNVLLSGYLANLEADFGGGVLGGQGTVSFVAKLSSAGNHLWSKTFPSKAATYTYSIAADAVGNVLLAGFFGQQVDFGGDPLNVGAGDFFDAFVAKFTPDGQHIWSRRAGGTTPGLYETGLGIAADPSGNVLVTGEFSTTICFGLDTLTSTGDFDAFLAKLPP